MPFDFAPGQSSWLPEPTPQERRRAALKLQAENKSEHDLQIECATVFYAGTLLLPGVLWFAIDNAFSLNMAIGRNGKPIGWGEVQKRKARGCKAGPPDFWFLYRARSYLIELKASPDSPLSDKQKEFLRDAIEQGAEVAICWAFWQVMNKLTEWELCRPHRVTA